MSLLDNDLPPHWKTDSDNENATTNTCVCCIDFLGVLGFFFGYFLGLPFLTDYSILFPMGIFVTVGCVALLLERLEPQLEEELLREYREEESLTTNIIITGTIIDREAKRHTVGEDHGADYEYRPAVDVAQVMTVYYVKLEYQVPFFSTTKDKNSQPFMVDGKLQEINVQDYDAVVHRSFAVPRDIYYGPNELNLVVLPKYGPLSGMLQCKLQEQVQSPRFRTRFFAGVGLIGMGVGVSTLVLGLSWQPWSQWDWVALLLHISITIIGIQFIHKTTLQKQQNVRSGKGSAEIHAIHPKGQERVSLSPAPAPPYFGSHDYGNGVTINSPVLGFSSTQCPKQGEGHMPVPYAAVNFG